MRAETSFKQFVIIESLNEAGSAEKPETFKIKWNRKEHYRGGRTNSHFAPADFNVHMYDFPKTIATDQLDMSGEELDRLDAMGIKTKSEVEDSEVTHCEMEYDFNFYWDEFGVEQIELILKSVKVKGRYAIWDEARDDSDWFDFEFEDLNPTGRYSSSIASKYDTFPLYPSDLEIHMADGFDTSKIHYEISLGSWR